MSTTTLPVRRSALERVHTHVGPGWPTSYGDPDGERLAVTEAIGLAEPGLYDKWILRGAGALAAVRSAGLEARPGFVTAAPVGQINVWAIAPDEVWLVGSAPTPGGPPATAIDFTPVIAAARSSGVHATDVSSGWSVLRLAGPRVRDLLEELVPEDLAPAALADLAIAQIPLAGCRVILHRRDANGISGFTLLVARDEAEHLWDAFQHVGTAHGIRPVGGAALLGTAIPAGATR
jgi:4-methylaminobutanoate oxidase (formaldehyde-forming)